MKVKKNMEAGHYPVNLEKNLHAFHVLHGKIRWTAARFGGHCKIAQT